MPEVTEPCFGGLGDQTRSTVARHVNLAPLGQLNEYLTGEVSTGVKRTNLAATQEARTHTRTKQQPRVQATLVTPHAVHGAADRTGQVSKEEAAVAC